MQTFGKSNHRYHILSLLFTAIGGQCVFASGNSDSASMPPGKFFLAVQAQQGGLWNTHKSDIVSNYYVGFDLRLGWQTDRSGQNKFDGLYRYPYYGIGYYMGNLNGITIGVDEKTQYGKPAALYGFFGSPFYKRKWLSINYDFSFGWSYNFNAYDPVIHPHNVLIGSKNNVYVNIAVVGKASLPGRASLGAGVSFQHFSNGAYQKPNKGLNLMSTTLIYQFGLYRNRDKDYARFPVERHEPKFEWNLFYGSGWRMLDTGFDKQHPAQNRRWYCAALSSAVMVQTSHRRKFGAGIDYFYFDWGRYMVEYRTNQAGGQATSKLGDNMSLGVYLAHEAGYKKLWLITDVGFYVTKRVGDDLSAPWLYERLGIKYQATRRLFVQACIKAHFGIADYMEWSVGYTLLSLRNRSSRK